MSNQLLKGISDFKSYTKLRKISRKLQPNTTVEKKNSCMILCGSLPFFSPVPTSLAALDHGFCQGEHQTPSEQFS